MKLFLWALHSPTVTGPDTTGETKSCVLSTIYLEIHKQEICFAQLLSLQPQQQYVWMDQLPPVLRGNVNSDNSLTNLPTKLLLMDRHIMFITSVLISYSKPHYGASRTFIAFWTVFVCSYLWIHYTTKLLLYSSPSGCRRPFWKIKIWKYMISYSSRATTD